MPVAVQVVEAAVEPGVDLGEAEAAEAVVVAVEFHSDRSPEGNTAYPPVRPELLLRPVPSLHSPRPSQPRTRLRSGGVGISVDVSLRPFV